MAKAGSKEDKSIRDKRGKKTSQRQYGPISHSEKKLTQACTVRTDIDSK